MNEQMNKMVLKQPNFSASLPPQYINLKTKTDDSGYFREDKMSPKGSIKTKVYPITLVIKKVYPCTNFQHCHLFFTMFLSHDDTVLI